MQNWILDTFIKLFFNFLSRFVYVWLQRFQKVPIWSQNICPKFSNMGIKKRRIWCRFRIRWKSSKKVYTKKVIGRRTFLHSTGLKGWKVHNFYTFMLITFLCELFLTFFQQIWSRHQILRFFTPISKRFNKRKSYFSTVFSRFSFTLLCRYVPASSLTQSGERKDTPSDDLTPDYM